MDEGASTVQPGEGRAHKPLLPAEELSGQLRASERASVFCLAFYVKGALPAGISGH